MLTRGLENMWAIRPGRVRSYPNRLFVPLGFLPRAVVGLELTARAPAMPQVSTLAREIVFKVVYYGPGLGGKTTSLQHVFATTKAEHRGKMVSLATPVDRTLYFDFLPIRIPSGRDMTVRLQLFTVPGQVYYNATRKLVLTGADGVVFVADSQLDRSDANVESLRNLEENLLEHGRGLDEIPHVFAYNKRDMDELAPIDEMERQLNSYGSPSFATVATSGEGVYEALEAITRAVLEDFERRVPERRGISPSPLMLPEGGLLEALRMVDEGDAHAFKSQPAPPASDLRADALDADELTDSQPPNEDVGEEAARVAVEPATLPGLGISSSNSPIALFRTRASSLATPPSEAPGPVASEVFARSHMPVPSSLFGIGMRSEPPSSPPDDSDAGWPSTPATEVAGNLPSKSQPPVSEAPLASAEPSSVVPASAVVDVSTGASTKEPGCSLSLLWPEDERATVLQIEQAIAQGETRDSTILCNALLQRCVESLAMQLGRPSIEAALAIMLLGIPASSYVEFLQRSLRARTKGQGIERACALKLLLFVTNCHLARERVTRL